MQRKEDYVRDRYTIDDLIKILKALRAPDGCPWDRVQTHESIKKSLIEDSDEAIDALDSSDDAAFANELGDVLLQVVFHASLAEERGAFNFDTVLNEICTKLITRHTHVFGTDTTTTSEEALGVWEKNKKKEKNLKSCTAVLEDVPHHFPALMRAEKVQKKAASFGFDWDDTEGVYKKISEETDELRAACESGSAEDIAEEYGDLLFSVVNLGRHIKVEPETALSAAVSKFIKRFGKMETEAKSEGRELEEMSLEEMDALWDKIKK